MNERQQQLLKLVVEEYIQSAEPVASVSLVAAADLDWSGATVRNELRALEEAGYLTHPHTSAGRIPTDLGYQFYIRELMSKTAAGKKIRSACAHDLESTKDTGVATKALAKTISEYLGSAVLVVFPAGSLYYTGIGNLFSQPEFRNYEIALSVSAMLDDCEARLPQIMAQLKNDSATVLIGNDNPLGGTCSFVVGSSGEGSLFGILGPVRMDYRSAIGAIDLIKEMMKDD